MLFQAPTARPLYNTAQGGSGLISGGTNINTNGGSGYGGAVFNLNGAVTIISSTLAANIVTAGTKQGTGSNGDANGGAVYNLAYGNDFTTGGTTTAQVTLRNSILANSTGGSDLVNDQRDITTTPDGSQGAGDNTASVDYGERNLVRTTAARSNTSFTGTLYSSADPNFGMLQSSNCQPAVLPLQAPSAAINAATVDANVATDQLGTTRPQGDGPDLGAVEFSTKPSFVSVATPTLNQGTSVPNTPLATVTDVDQAKQTLTVTATPTASNGVTLGTLSVDNSGTVKAPVTTDACAKTATFTLRVTDNGGLFEEQTLTISVNPDTTRPDTNLTGLPASVSGPDVSFTFSGSDNCPTNLTFRCKLDTGDWGACTSIKSYTGLASGQHTFQVQAVDAAMNEDLTPASYTWQVFVATCGTVVNPATMPAATRGTPFVQTLSAQPTGSYVFSLLAGQLPPGLSLVNTVGIYSLRGTPTTAGNYTFTIKGTKANSTCAGARSYTINVP